MSRKSRKKRRRIERRRKRAMERYNYSSSNNSLKNGTHLTEYEVVYRYKNTTRKMIERIATNDIKKSLACVNEPFEVLKVYVVNEKRKKFLFSSNIKFEISVEEE